MKISIIIPVYNVELYISQCVESILSQSYSDFEIILVNDGSTDSSGSICDLYAQRDHRIAVIHQQNGGLSEARNTGLKASKGEFVIFLDSDDFWTTKYGLEKLVEEISHHQDIDFLAFNCMYYYPLNNKYIKWKPFSSSIIQEENKHILLTQLVKSGVFPMSACLKIIRRDFLIDNELFFKKGLISEDIPWFIDLLDKSSSFKFLNLYLYGYRQNRIGSITQKFTVKSFDDLLSIIKDQLSKLEYRSFNLTARNSLYSFLAYEFCIALARLRELPDSVYYLKRGELIEYKWLLRYTDNPKVKLVSFVRKVIGLRLTEKVLNIFMKTK